MAAVDAHLRRLALVQGLADGAWHSGEALAAALGVSRTAVWKHAGQLAEWGLELESEAGRGYRLSRPVSLLDGAGLRAALAPACAASLRTLTVAPELGSTNAELLAVKDLPVGQFDLCLAEFQSAGRGRRGRVWQSPFAAGLCLSLSWTFRELPAGLGALSLATGVAVRQALASCQLAAGVRLKWPNDLLQAGRKLGGVLIELRAEAGGPAYVVIGVGLNVDLPPATREAVAATGLALADLTESALQLGLALPSRTRLAATLAQELHAMLVQFSAAGFAPFREAWSGVDALLDQPVRLVEAAGERRGIARGIDSDGALRVEFAAAGAGMQPTVERVMAGEVMHLRPVT